MTRSRYMVIETFKHGADPVYARFKEKGRQLPDCLNYVDSWLTADEARCFQIMETAVPESFDKWIAAWSDLVDFEVIRLGEKPV